MFYSLQIKTNEILTEIQFRNIFIKMFRDYMSDNLPLVPILTGEVFDLDGVKNGNCNDNCNDNFLSLGCYQIDPETMKIPDISYLFNVENISIDKKIFCVYLNIETNKLEFIKLKYFNEGIFIRSENDISRFYSYKQGEDEIIFLLTSRSENLKITHDLLSKEFELSLLDYSTLFLNMILGNKEKINDIVINDLLIN